MTITVNAGTGKGRTLDFIMCSNEGAYDEADRGRKRGDKGRFGKIGKEPVDLFGDKSRHAATEHGAEIRKKGVLSKHRLQGAHGEIERACADDRADKGRKHFGAGVLDAGLISHDGVLFDHTKAHSRTGGLSWIDAVLRVGEQATTIVCRLGALGKIAQNGEFIIAVIR